jgi:hypothetical protein
MTSDKLLGYFVRKKILKRGRRNGNKSLKPAIKENPPKSLTPGDNPVYSWL